MSEKIADLKPEDRSHFLGVLAKYGQHQAGYEGGRLDVPKDGVTLSKRTKDGGHHVRLSTHDLDEMKRWLGVPDAVVKGDSEFKAPAAKAGPADLKALAGKSLVELTPEESAALTSAVHAYVWGDSEALAEAKPVLESLVAPMEGTVHVYTTLDLKGPLTFDDDSATIVLANTINYYPGGSIESTVPLSVQATSIFKHS